MPNKHVNLTAEKRCFSVPSVLRTPAAGYVRRCASPSYGAETEGILDQYRAFIQNAFPSPSWRGDEY